MKRAANPKIGYDGARGGLRAFCRPFAGLILPILIAIMTGQTSSQAALSATNLASSGDTTNTTAYTTASFTPTANLLIVAFFDASRGSSTAPDIPTLSGGSLSWSQVGDLTWTTTGTTRFRVTCFAAQVGGSPSSMTVTATYANALTGCQWSVFQVSGSDVANGVAQCFVQAVASSANLTGTSISITLSSAGNANNRAFLCVAHASNETYTIATNWSQIGAGGNNSPSTSIGSQWRSDTFDTNPNTSWTTSTNYGGIGFEVKADTSGGAAALFRNRTGSRARVTNP